MTSRWQHTNIIQWIGRHAPPLGLAAIVLQLAWRNVGLYPVVFADEWLYSSSARLLPWRGLPRLRAPPRLYAPSRE